MTLRSILLRTVAALALLLVYMVCLASSAPMIRRLQVHLANWPPGTPPVRIVLMSDLHVSTPGDTPARLRKTIATVNQLQPDLVLLAGDYIATGILGARADPPAHAIAPLAALHARLGSWAVLGNHDYQAERQVRLALLSAGVEILDNQAVRIGPLALVGISDAFSSHANVPAAIASWRTVGGLPIVLTHSPDVIPALPATIGLVLAGHTHCGQVSLPFIGPPITQSRYGRRYACGIVREGSRVSLITAGLGTSGEPIRFLAPPDLWVIDVGR